MSLPHRSAQYPEVGGVFITSNFCPFEAGGKVILAREPRDKFQKSLRPIFLVSSDKKAQSWNLGKIEGLKCEKGGGEWAASL